MEIPELISSINSLSLKGIVEKLSVLDILGHDFPSYLKESTTDGKEGPIGRDYTGLQGKGLLIISDLTGFRSLRCNTLKGLSRFRLE